MTYTVRNHERIFAFYQSRTAAERYYLICACYNDPSIYIRKEYA